MRKLPDLAAAQSMLIRQGPKAERCGALFKTIFGPWIQHQGLMKHSHRVDGSFYMLGESGTTSNGPLELP